MERTSVSQHAVYQKADERNSIGLSAHRSATFAWIMDLLFCVIGESYKTICARI